MNRSSYPATVRRYAIGIAGAIAISTSISATSPVPSSPTVVRVVVLDTSGSMAAADRLPVAIKEIQQFAGQLPPSPGHPLILVEFGDTAAVHTFTDPADLHAHLGRVEAQGGTRIAEGLKAARTELARYAAASVVVLLFSDGEDSDLDAISLEEKALDELFAERSRDGVNSVVVCRRWANANARLVERLKAGGHAQVIDAGGLQLRPATYKPAVEVVKTEWLSDERAITVEFRAKLRVTGDIGPSEFPPAVFTCETPGASGDGKQSVVPAADVSFHRRVRVTADQLRVGAVLFTFGVMTATSGAIVPDILIPIPAVDRLTVKVPLPPVDCRVAATATAGTARWHQPLTRIAAVPIDVSFAVSTTQKWGWDVPCSIDLHPDAEIEVIEGPTAVSVRETGKRAIRVVLAVPVSKDATEIQFAVVCEATSASPIVRWQAASARLNLSVSLPPLAVTALCPTSQTPATVAWEDVVDGVARVGTEVEVRVDGPLPAGVEFGLVVPTGVRDLVIDPAHLQSGSQIVRISFVVPLAPNSTRAFSFAVAPPPSMGAVTFTAAPLILSLTAPPPVLLGLADPGGPITALEASVPDTAVLVPFRLMPVLFDDSGLLASREFDVELVPGPTFARGQSPIAAVDAEVDLSLPLPDAADRPFWRDLEVTGEVSVLPRSANAAIQGTVYPVVIRIEAPFKRYAFWGSVGFGLLALAWGTVIVYGRMTTPVNEYPSQRSIRGIQS